MNERELARQANDAVFDLTTVSPEARVTVTAVLETTFASTEITDRDLHIYVGFVRENRA